MRNPTTHDDTSSREDNNHVEREPSANVGKKGKCIRVKGTMSTLFGRTPFPARLLHAQYGGKQNWKDWWRT
jgi:hypothetical protein